MTRSSRPAGWFSVGCSIAAMVLALIISHSFIGTRSAFTLSRGRAEIGVLICLGAVLFAGRATEFAPVNHGLRVVGLGGLLAFVARLIAK